MTRRLLLLSNSQCFGQGYLDHAADELADFLGDRRRLVFVPFALKDHGGYGARVGRRLETLGLEVETLSADDSARRRLLEAIAVFVGGGNTFRLLDTLQRGGLIEVLRERLRDGLPYIGSSAGTNLVAPTIMTTNDMPIVQPESFEALGAVPFQINPHYVDPDPGSRHMGETREQRLREFHEENRIPVVGLREGSWLRVEDDRARLGGLGGARIFRQDRAPEERQPGASFDDLLC
jgi:dipeptidase E